MVKLLCVGGGSGGHLSPCLASSRALESLTDTEVLTICSTTPIDRVMLRHAGQAFRSISAPKIRRYAAWQIFLLPFQFPFAFLRALGAIRGFRPDVVLASGGAVTVPACLAAHFLGIPVVLLDLDAAPGLANRICSRLAAAICLGRGRGEGSADEGARPRRIVTGLPVRGEVLQGSADRGRAITGFSGKRPILLVMGGSQGARSINDAVRAQLPSLLDCCDVVHLTGMGKAPPTPSHARYWQREFVLGELPHLLALATCVLSRAGASALAEFAALGVPAILVPLPRSAQDHQRQNAARYAQRGAAVILDQDHLSTSLLPTLQVIVTDPARVSAMSAAMRACADPEAAVRVAQVLLDTAERSP